MTPRDTIFEPMYTRHPTLVRALERQCTRRKQPMYDLKIRVNVKFQCELRSR
jgi:hypothetical protein